jgi:hypothetical protein
MAQQITSARSYRCSYHPKDLNGYPIAADSGVLPTIQLKASNAEHAQRAAFALTGCVVANVERLDASEQEAA